MVSIAVPGEFLLAAATEIAVQTHPRQEAQMLFCQMSLKFWDLFFNSSYADFPLSWNVK